MDGEFQFFSLPVDATTRTVLGEIEGTKFSLLKGSSENPAVDLLAGYFAEVEANIHTFA